MRRPEVLVLEIDQPPGPSKGLGVGPGDAALTVRSERIRRLLDRIGPKDLHRVRTASGRIAQHRRERIGPPRLAGEPGKSRAQRVAMVERGRVVPPLAEGEGEIPDRRALDLELDVVPRRPFAVPVVDVDGLGIAPVVLVVVAAVAQIDAADEADVIVLPARVPQQDELLMMRPAPAHPFVEQDLGARVVDRLGEVDGLLLAHPHLVGVRTPDQTPARRPRARPPVPASSPARCPVRPAARRDRPASRTGRRGRPARRCAASRPAGRSTRRRGSGAAPGCLRSMLVRRPAGGRSRCAGCPARLHSGTSRPGPSGVRPRPGDLTGPPPSPNLRC